MPFLFRRADEGFDRLQDLLLAMRAGDVLHLGDAARVSGLSEDTCLTALEALEQVGLMSRETDGRFIRRTLETVTH